MYWPEGLTFPGDSQKKGESLSQKSWLCAYSFGQVSIYLVYMGTVLSTFHGLPFKIRTTLYDVLYVTILQIGKQI